MTNTVLHNDTIIIFLNKWKLFIFGKNLHEKTASVDNLRNYSSSKEWVKKKVKSKLDQI